MKLNMSELIDSLKPQRLSRTAVIMGSITVLASWMVGYFAYTSNRQAILRSMYEDNLSLARVLARHVETSIGSNRQILREVELLWMKTGSPHPGSYACAVGTGGRLLVHTAEPSRVGANVGMVRLAAYNRNEPTDLRELVAARKDYVGPYITSDGQRQIAAFAYTKKLDGLVAVHVPMTAVDAKVRSSTLPWAIGLGLITTTLLPVGFGLFHRAYSASQKILERATSALQESERETHRNLDRIRALHEIDLAITSTLDLRTVLDVLLEKTERLLPHIAATTVRLLDDETGDLTPVACRNLPEEEWKAATAAATKQGIRRMLPDGKNFSVAGLNSRTDAGLLASGFLRKCGLASALRVPLTAKSTVLGVITFLTSKEHEFGSGEIEFLCTLAGQAAIAIHNAQLYEQTKKQAEELERSNRVKDEFLSVMSHELRTPLSVVMGYTNLMKDGMLGEVNDRQVEALKKMHKRTAEQLAMINEIMQTTQLDSRSTTIQRMPVNVGGLLDALRQDYDLQADRSAVTLLWNYPVRPLTMTTDGAKLKQILHNLINNALKFTDEGTVAVSAQVTGIGDQELGVQASSQPPMPNSQFLTPNSRFVEFKVTDTGIGIPGNQLSSIFDKFHQVDSSETRIYGGVGLGLYIVKQFTEMLGGKVEVESEVGKGSTFTVRVPV